MNSSPPSSASVHHDSTSHHRLGDLLVDEGVTSRAQLEAVAREPHKGKRLGELLIEHNIATEEQVYRALSLMHAIPLARVEALLRKLDHRVAQSISRAFLERHHLLPLCREPLGISVVTADPTVDLRDLSKALGAPLCSVQLVTPTDYKRLWQLIELRSSAAEGESVSTETVDLLTSTEHHDARYVAIFEALLVEAIAEGASDLHLEVYFERVRIRMRVDGDLHDSNSFQLSRTDLIGLVNVIKIQAAMDIAERRVPQGGRIRTRSGGKSFDLRVQTQPSLHGEHVVIRLLPQESKVLTIEELGFPKELADLYRRLLDSPSGMILVVGPTGSGKSTTLYAGLQYASRDETRKVITVEDPIEYSIAGVQQCQVRPDLGFSFQHAMRAFVREDPDVILVGEIRDGETALEALRASQTGHLVLSTLHCNDAVDVVQRLLDLGSHPNSIASELLAVFAQRLARRICDHCRVPAEPEPKILAELFPQGIPKQFRCFKGAGCEHCNQRGTRGRIAVIEYLRSGPSVRRGISKHLPVDDLRRIGLNEGLVAMRSSALHLVQQGTIPLSEVPWVLPADRMAPEVADPADLQLVGLSA